MHCDKCAAETRSPRRVTKEKKTPSTYELIVQYVCDVCFDTAVMKEN